MSLVLQSSGGGSVTVQEPVTASNFTQTLQASTGTVALTSQLGATNRIINGNMVIDQRNAGASVTPTVDAQYTLDRWGTGLSAASKFSVQQNAGSVTPPAGFSNYLGVTSLAATSLGATDYFLQYQKVEGYNAADLDFGKSTAKTITISFWIRSSLTGTFGASILNSAANRCYPFSYTISAANTWEQKSVTIAGDTTGTWLTTNGTGLQIVFSLGVGSTYSGTANAWTSSSFIFQPTGSTSVVGTNGATWYVTGVQLEVGSTATAFQFRQYGQELALCQRYYEKETCPAFVNGRYAGGFNPDGSCPLTFKTSKRANPTSTVTYVSNIDNSSNASLNASNLGGILVTVIISNVYFAYAGANITYTASCEL
jgi:hypothetical protein